MELLGKLEVTLETAGCECLSEYLATVERGESNGFGG